MIRLLIFGVLGYLLYQLFTSKPTSPKKKPSNFRATSNNAGKMVKCVACGLYIPENEAIVKRRPGGKLFYCSEKCASRDQSG